MRRAMDRNRDYDQEVLDAFQQGMQAFEAGLYQNAAASFRSVVALDPEMTSVYCYLASIELSEGNARGALSWVESGFNQTGEDPYLHFLCAMCCEDLGDCERAISHYQRYLEENPLDEEALLSLGVSYESLGNIDRAVDTYEQILQLNEEHYRAAYNLALMKETLGDLESALELHRKVLHCNPEFRNSLVRRGTLALNAGFFEEAVGSYEKLLMDAQEVFPGIYFNLALAYEKLRNYKKSFDSFKLAVEEDPNDLEALKKLGNSALHLGYSSEALDVFQRLLSENLEDDEAHFNIARCHLACGSLTEAYAELGFLSFQQSPFAAVLEAHISNHVSAMSEGVES